ncbi:MAG: hypothetical protein WBZ48_07625 [Bacteroidota bacterium]
MQKEVSIVFFFSIISIISGILLLHLPTVHPVVIFGSMFIAASVMFTVMAWTLFRVEVPTKILFGIVAVGLIVRLSFVTTSPIGSEDAYRYVWDGKVEAYGTNPYLYAALDSRLDSLHSPHLPAAMNHADLKTIYFPLSEWIFYLSYRLSGEAFWGYKTVFLLAEVGTICALFLLLSMLHIPQKFILLYAVSPLPIFEFAVDAHLDAVGLPLFLFSLLFYLKERKTLSYVFLGLSMSIKPVGLILLPALFFFEKGWRNKLYALLIPLTTVGVQFLPYIFSSNPFETLFTFTKDWSFNGAVFESVYACVHDNQLSRLFCAGILGLLVFLLNVKRRDLPTTAYFSLLALMLLSPVVHPWYVAWMAVLLPVMRRWSGIAFVAGVSLTSFTVMNYRLTGLWVQYPAVLVIEYLPVILLMIVELREYFLKRQEQSAARSGI